MESGNPPNPQVDFLLKETRPFIAARGHGLGQEAMYSYHLVEQMEYIFIHVVKAMNLPAKDGTTARCNACVELKLGDCCTSTRLVEEVVNPIWDQVFAFSQDQVRGSTAEIVIRGKSVVVAAGGRSDDGFVGKLTFDLNQIPKCERPNKLAPEWYKLQVGRAGEEAAQEGELLMGVWVGTQADEFFPRAWHSDSSTNAADYMLPKLWYVRVNVIEAQDLASSSDDTRSPEVRVLVVLGNQAFRTGLSRSKTMISPLWNEDLLFIATGPFKEQLVLTVEEVGGLGRHEYLGTCSIPLQYVDRRLDHRPVTSRWYSLSRVAVANTVGGQPGYHGRIHLRICFEGGYRVQTEATNNCSNFRPSGKQLWKPSIGVLELGIIRAHGLLSIKRNNGEGRTDAYCVAKYGMKWVRTRTITDSCNPKWNEQYTWEVFDPFTVITVAVFDDHYLNGSTNNSRLGKIRIRVSSLESGRVYRHRYPLLLLRSSGVEEMGEIELAMKFTCSSWINMLQLYSQPLLPKMHYFYPLTVRQLDTLRDVSVEIISRQFDKAEPPLTKEVVDYLLDVDLAPWSLRRSRAHYLRVINTLRWFDKIYKWETPSLTIFIHILLVTFSLYPKILPTTIFLSLFLISIWNYRGRPSHPPHMDSHLSLGDVDDPDELDEEFDTFPTSQPSDIVKRRYDRLRSTGSKIETELQEWVALGERFQCLVTWRDPRATVMFLPFCASTAILLYFVQLRVVTLVLGFYLLRHPWLRSSKAPRNPVINFFRRLPTKEDHMM